MTDIENPSPVLIFPWPPSILSPNARAHWAKKMPVKNAYKQECYLIAKQYKPDFDTGNIPVSIVFYPPSNRGDLDNMLASCKALFDGVADAWGINDKRFRPITLDVKKKIASPVIEIYFKKTRL